jgi:hypothetical protein
MQLAFDVAKMNVLSDRLNNKKISGQRLCCNSVSGKVSHYVHLNTVARAGQQDFNRAQVTLFFWESKNVLREKQISS